jgi:hypothetical protein
MLGAQSALPNRSIERGGRGGVLEFQDGTRKSDKLLVTHSDLHSTNQQIG